MKLLIIEKEVQTKHSLFLQLRYIMNLTAYKSIIGSKGIFYYHTKMEIDELGEMRHLFGVIHN